MKLGGYYSDLYRDPSPNRPMIERVEFEHIDEGHHCRLERPFMEEEVKEALLSLEEDKAPGPNGFPIKFLLVCWEVVGRDMMAVFEAFHSKDQWCKLLRATFITLILKEGAVHIKDFRPISFVGCLYKLLAKVLAIRLKGSIALVISELQNAFVPGRQLLDCSVLANEVINAIRKVD